MKVTVYILYTVTRKILAIVSIQIGNYYVIICVRSVNVSQVN